MERSDKNKPKWIKTSPGTLYPFSNQRGRRVKHREEIRATTKELAHVIDQFELVENIEGKNKVNLEDLKPKEEVIESPEKDEYSVESAGSGWYNVVSSTGKIMNEKKLRAEEAKELRIALEEETETE